MRIKIRYRYFALTVARTNQSGFVFYLRIGRQTV